MDQHDTYWLPCTTPHALGNVWPPVVNVLATAGPLLMGQVLPAAAPAPGLLWRVCRLLLCGIPPVRCTPHSGQGVRGLLAQPAACKQTAVTRRSMDSTSPCCRHTSLCESRVHHIVAVCSHSIGSARWTLHTIIINQARSAYPCKFTRQLYVLGVEPRDRNPPWRLPRARGRKTS
jgi:hypothetical protein